jgi:hypothetical protein
MNMKRRIAPGPRRAQRGAALIVLAAILVLGTSWMLVSRLNAVNANRTTAEREHNARVLAEAKAALVAWMATTALDSSEDNPGRLPCPQYWGDVGSSTEGRAGASCISSSLQPAAGWLPWRTLGMSKPLDASGQQLWYIVSPGWAARTDGTTLTINSNSLGQLTVDGQANAAVALVIAPGRPLSIAPNANQQAAGCTARDQSQALALPGTAPSVLDFLDCQNGTTSDGNFATSVVDNSTNTVLNDQVITVTTADLLPTLEAAIAKRIERDIAPALKTVFTSSTWGFSGTDPIYPFAAPFTNPGPGAGTSNYQGTFGTYQGLLPFNQTQGCTESPSEPRCTTTFLAFSKSTADVQTGGSGSILTQSSCSWQSDTYVCTGEYQQPSISVTVKINLSNVAMGLRKLDPTKISFTAMNDFDCTPTCWGTQTVAHTDTATLNSDGSLTLTIAGGMLPDISAAGWGTYANYRVSIERAAVGDHSLLSSTDPTTGWFVRNEWYRLVYYAVASGHTAATLPPSCSTGSTCLTVANVSPSGAQRALLVLAGRSINGATRPSATLSDYLEFGNVTGSFEQLTVTPWSGTVYADTGTADAYAVSTPSVAAGTTFVFRATNANTGSSTLTTPATGQKELVNADGSALAANAILANGAVQVLYDANRFLLAKRPFNDRIAVIASN